MKFNKKVSPLTSMSNKSDLRKSSVVQESSFELLHFDFHVRKHLEQKSESIFGR